MIRFQDPYLLLLLLIIPLYIFFQLWFKRKFHNKIIFPHVNLILKALNNKKRSYSVVDIIRYLAIFFLLLALASPEIQSQNKVAASYERSDTDIVICLDVSGSMLMETIKDKRNPRVRSNRLNDAKLVIENFVNQLRGQQVSLVTFSNSAKILTPLSDDYSMVIDKTKSIEISKDEQQLTAMGMGIALSSAVLKDSPAKSKFIILITDGVNNTGVYKPLQATETFAVPFDLKVYPIGFNASLYHTLIRGSDVDIETLNQIAELTGTGQAELASSSEALERIINNIGRSEKIHEEKELPYAYYSIHQYLIGLAFILLLIEFYLRKVYYYEVQ